MQSTTFEGHPALSLANDKLRLTVLKQGTTIAAISLTADPQHLSPLWDPVRMAREAGENNIFGTGLGHFLCVDGFGETSQEESKAGLPGHGEAHERQWDVTSQSKNSLAFSTVLPLAQEHIARTFRLVDGEQVVSVETHITSDLAFDRPVFWAEHATIGSPFLEPATTVVNMSAKQARTRPYDAAPVDLPHRLPPGQDFTWPIAPSLSGGTLDMRLTPNPPNSGDHTTSLMDTSRTQVFLTALNPKKHLLLGYIFRRAEYPWTQSWEFYPPNGKLARGLEFSTLPFDVPRRQAVDENKLFGTPMYRWLPAKSSIESRFLIFLTQVPEGFGNVDDVRVENGSIVVEDRASGKRVTLVSSQTL